MDCTFLQLFVDSAPSLGTEGTSVLRPSTSSSVSPDSSPRCCITVAAAFSWPAGSKLIRWPRNYSSGVGIFMLVHAAERSAALKNRSFNWKSYASSAGRICIAHTCSIHWAYGCDKVISFVNTSHKYTDWLVAFVWIQKGNIILKLLLKEKLDVTSLYPLPFIIQVSTSTMQVVLEMGHMIYYLPQLCMHTCIFSWNSHGSTKQPQKLRTLEIRCSNKGLVL